MLRLSFALTSIVELNRSSSSAVFQVVALDQAWIGDHRGTKFNGSTAN